MSDSPTHDVSLKELAARLARGEEAAFAELYDACADRLHGYLAARLGSRDAASDVLQSTFLRAVKSRRRFRGVENPIAYMFQIARNEAARIARKRPFVDARVPTLPNLSCKRRTIRRRRSHRRRDRAARPQDRELVELKMYAGLTFREIADDRRPTAGNRRHPLSPCPRIAARLADQTVSLTCDMIPWRQNHSTNSNRQLAAARRSGAPADIARRRAERRRARTARRPLGPPTGACGSRVAGRRSRIERGARATWIRGQRASRAGQVARNQRSRTHSSRPQSSWASRPTSKRVATSPDRSAAMSGRELTEQEVEALDAAA